MTIIKYLDNNDSAGIGVYEIGSETVVSLEALRKEHVQRESHGCFKRNTASYEQNFVGIVISYALIAPKTAKGGQYGGSAVEERFADRIMRIADAMSPDGNIAALKFVNASESQSGLSHLLNGNLNGMRILLKDVILREGEEGGFVGDSDIPVLLAQGGIFPLQDLSSIWAFKTITSTKIASRTRSVTRAVLFPNCYLDVSNITYKEANCNGSFCDRTMATSIVNEKEAKCICIRSRVQSVGGRMVLSMNLQLYSAVDADGNVSGDPMSIRFSPFQSLAWSKFLLGTTIQSTNSDIVELNQGIKHMVDFVRQRVIAVNKNRGWFVYGWYKLGMQQNKTDTKTAAAASSSGGTSGSNFKLKGRQQDDAGGHMGATEVLYHAVKIMPTMITAYMGNNAGAHEYVFQKDVNENRMVRGEAANDTLNEVNPFL
jgi:hypothetical protein